MPPLAVRGILDRRDLGQPWRRGQQHAARGEDALQGRQRTADVIDELERLRDDGAVERVVRDMGCVAEVADDRRLWIAILRHEDVHAQDVAAEPVRVVGRGDLENSSADVVGVATDETLDIDPVDRRAALEAPIGVDRGRAPELPELRWAMAPALDHGRAKRPEPATKRCRHDSPPTRGKNVLFAGSQGPR